MEAFLLVVDLCLMIVFLLGICRAEASDDPNAPLAGLFAYKQDKSDPHQSTTRKP